MALFAKKRKVVTSSDADVQLKTQSPKRKTYLFYVLCFALSVFELPLSAETPEVSSSTVSPIAVSTETFSAATPTSLVTSTTTIVISTTVAIPVTPALLTMLHPTENQRLPQISQVFAFGRVSPGSTLTINGAMIPVHPKGSYLTMVPLVPGENLLKTEVRDLAGASAVLDRHVSVNPGFVITRSTPLTIESGSITPVEEMTLQEGDAVRVSFQGSPGGKAEFSIGRIKQIPMAEVNAGSPTARGIYQGVYIVRETDVMARAVIEVSLKKGWRTTREKAIGRVTVERLLTPRIGMITDEMASVRTAPEGGYDLFLYKGMKVRLTGKSGGQYRVRLSSLQSGWVKESAIQELPLGAIPPQSVLGTIHTSRQTASTLVRTTFSEPLPYRVEQSIDPMLLSLTVYGASAKVDLIKYDPTDTLIGQVRWRQIAPDAVQILIEPTFPTWWGYDVRYEGSTLVVEVREPWKSQDLKGLPIAIDAGHGGSDHGAMGPLGTLEKNTNLAIAKEVQQTLANAGAEAFLIRGADTDVPLGERGKTAWKAGARLFISIHGNSSGLWSNPVWNNGSSIYFYHAQSKAFAEAIHSEYRRQLAPLPDHGLYYADLAVCRITQMPSILTEQAFIIVPDQEQMLLDPKFAKSVAAAILSGLRDYLKIKR